MKKASELVTYALKQVGRPYWGGGFGQLASRPLYDQNRARLGYGPWNNDYDRDAGQKVHDCCGMVKGFMWTDGPDVPWRAGQYEINGCGDWSVREFYNKCSEKGDVGKMFDSPGLLLFNNSLGHMGIYVGDGYVVEARDHERGVQKNLLKDRTSFTRWGKLDVCIQYDEEKYVETNKIKTFQTFLNNNYGVKLVVDGGFGPLTRTATVKAIQIELNKKGESLEVDGGFGPLTKAAMSRHMIKQGDSGNLVYILQGLLYGHGYDPKGFDGSFGVNGGTGCLNALKQYQKDHNLEVDGKAGGETFGSMVRNKCL